MVRQTGRPPSEGEDALAGHTRWWSKFKAQSHRKLALELARQAERREGGAARAERERWKAVSKELRRLSHERRR